MFYLSGDRYPRTTAELSASLADSLKAAFILPGDGPVVEIDGTSLNAIRVMRIDLSGASARLGMMPPPPRGAGDRQPAASVASLRIEAHPLNLANASVDFSLQANGVDFNFDRDAQGKPLLLFATAQSGNVAIEASQSSLEALVLTAARMGSAQQGVQIQKVGLALSQIDPRTVGFIANITAKKVIMSATIVIRGQVAIDEALNARLANLSCDGQGMMATMACGFIRPHLEKANNQSFPRGALSMGGVRLQDLKVSAGDPLRVTAELGN